MTRAPALLRTATVALAALLAAGAGLAQTVVSEGGRGAVTTAAGDPTAPTAPYSTGARAGEKANEAGEFVKDRWQPLALLGASTTALAVFVRQLGKK